MVGSPCGRRKKHFTLRRKGAKKDLLFFSAALRLCVSMFFVSLQLPTRWVLNKISNDTEVERYGLNRKQLCIRFCVHR